MEKGTLKREEVLCPTAGLKYTREVVEERAEDGMGRDVAIVAVDVLFWRTATASSPAG